MSEDTDKAPEDEASAICAELVAERLHEAGLDTEQFIDVQDGCKRSTNHDRFGPQDVNGNYGIYANGEVSGGLVGIDIDDYTAVADEALAVLSNLPPTLTVETPHTDGESGGHRFYVVQSGEEFDTAQEACEGVWDGATNPGPSWGEVRVHNQYVVGPGSQLDGCDKDWCTDCETHDGGRYAIADDRPIATISADDLAAMLRADSNCPDTSAHQDGRLNGSTDATTENGAQGYEAMPDNLGYPDPELVVEAKDLVEGYPRDSDRSTHDWVICKELARHGIPKDIAERWFQEHLSISKVVERDDIDYGGTWTTAANEVRDEDGELGSYTVEVIPTETEDIPVSVSRTKSTAIDEPDTDGRGNVLTERWQAIESLYVEDTTPKHVARDAAFNQINQQEHLLALRDTENLYRYDQQMGIYKPDGEQYIGGILDRRLGSFYTTNERSQIISRLKDRNWTDREQIDGPKGMVCVSNGVLDLSMSSDPTLRPHSPEHEFIRSLPYAVNPTAPDTFDPHEECPEFVAFLDDVVRDEDRDKLQEYAGYCLLTWGQPFKRALVCLGPTDSGKSTFLSVLHAILGPKNVANESLYSLVQTRGGTANLYDAFANIRNELSPGDLKHPQKFKEITSGSDAIDAERKGEDKFTFVPTAKHLFAANQVPSMDAADEAFYNRWLFVTFPTSVPRHEQERNLSDKLLREEASGILNWMIAGYARLVKQQGFSGERLLGEKEEMWHAYGDSVDRFVDRCLDVTGDKDDRLSKRDAYTAYKAMCDNRGLAPERKQALTRDLKRQSGVDDAKPRNNTVNTVLPDERERIRCYTGLQLTDQGRDYIDAGSNDSGGSTDSSISDY
ncbi:phage/plasmid primase, P4 family [Haloarcula sp. JP-L23]|uniref:phage/plasmid primase, P4 family n=1 Tax=Haloarcula sp. JP-L23 TaxID=2716717 RepID=UPI00140EC471|nr:hypothetical protein G9465_02565 [Haloarcula sp. JP-L23]